MPVFASCSAFSPCNLSATGWDNLLYASAMLTKIVSPPASGHSSMYRNTSPDGCGFALLSICQAREVVRDA